MSRQRISNPALFVCDIQDKFRPAIHEFPKVVSTTQKLLKASKIFSIPIYITTQNAGRLGETVQEITSLLPDRSSEQAVHSCDKTAFSMLVPDISNALAAQSKPPTSGPLHPVTAIIVGIETHICVTQTALDLLSLGHKVYILQDGVSSCNAGERPVALERLRKEGCVITTSESILFELVGDASDKDFKAVANLVKETKEETKAAVGVLCGKL